MSYEPPLVRWSRLTLEFIQKYYLYILGGIALLFALLFGYYAWQKHELEILTKGHTELQSILNDVNTFLSNPPDDPKERETRKKEILQKLTEIEKNYRGEAPAYEAAYHRGQLLLYGGTYQEAISAFKKAESYGYPLAVFARLGEAQALAGLEKYNEALKVLDELEKTDSPYLLKDVLLYYRGKWLIETKKPEEARKVLETLIQEHEKSSYKALAEKLLDSLPSQAEPAKNE